MGGRYYSPITKQYLSPANPETTMASAATIYGLNLYLLTLTNPISMGYNGYTIATNSQLAYDPDELSKWDLFWGKYGGYVVGGLQIAAGAILCATGVGAGLGCMLIAGGMLSITSTALGSHIGGGISSMMNGGGAIGTGISLCAFGPWGVAAGIALMLVGAGTMAFGANEVAYGITGTNYFQEWGMSDGWYNGLYLGLNIGSTVGTVAGNIGMRIASNNILNSIVQNPETIVDYKLWQIKTYGRYTSQYTVGALDGRSVKAGQGYTLTHNTQKSLGYIQYHPGGGHHGSLAYWKVTSSYNPAARFWYLTGLPC